MSDRQYLLILTVGTGTAGLHSDLHQGLIKTIEFLCPKSYWLIPSLSRDSWAMAELVAESIPAGFTPWSEQQKFNSIPKHDDIDSCRQVVRQVIARAKSLLGSGERLIVNPTSGTKQMSVAATIAALDEEVGDVCFTVGQRSDGVVRTGTERLAGFDAMQFFVERDLRAANELFSSGAFSAAARVLAKYTADANVFPQRSKCLCMHEWQRLNYAAAASEAAHFSEKIRLHLTKLDKEAQGGRHGLNVLADLIAGADQLRSWDAHDEASTRYYKAVEFAARMRLSENINSRYPFKYSDLSKLPLSKEIVGQLRRNTDGTCTPGLNLFLRILRSLGDPFAEKYFRSRELGRALGNRNKSMHDIRPILPKESASQGNLTRNFLMEFYSDLDIALHKEIRPKSIYEV